MAAVDGIVEREKLQGAEQEEEFGNTLFVDIVPMGEERE